MKRLTCRACGEPFSPSDVEDRLWRLRLLGIAAHESEGLYCGECADELFRGRISTRPAQLHSSGHAGGGGEPSPWQEDAIRHLEGG